MRCILSTAHNVCSYTGRLKMQDQKTVTGKWIDQRPEDEYLQNCHRPFSVKALHSHAPLWGFGISGSHCPWTQQCLRKWHRNVNSHVVPCTATLARGWIRQTSHLSDVSDESVEVVAFPVSIHWRITYVTSSCSCRAICMSLQMVARISCRQVRMSAAGSNGRPRMHLIISLMLQWFW